MQNNWKRETRVRCQTRARTLLDFRVVIKRSNENGDHGSLRHRPLVHDMRPWNLNKVIDTSQYFLSYLINNLKCNVDKNFVNDRDNNGRNACKIIFLYDILIIISCENNNNDNIVGE